MKIEIDLNDIFGGNDEGPGETLQDSIKRQVVETLIRRTSEGIGKAVQEKTAEAIDRLLAAEVEKLMPQLVGELMDRPYQQVGRYGERGKVTTFREQLLEKIVSEMDYKPSSDSYGRSNENVFTKAVRGVIDGRLAEFKKAFDKTVDTQFVVEALAHASAKLRERMGVK